MGLTFAILNVILSLIIGICIFLIFWKIVRVSNPYEFVLVFMNPGVNDHVIVRESSMNFDYKYKKKKYSIKSINLYRVKPRIFTRLIFKIRGIKQRFLIIFQHRKKTPISPIKVKVSARILNEVNESRALDKALRSEFHVPMDLKKLLMIMGFIVIVAVVYLVVTGQVQL